MRLIATPRPSPLSLLFPLLLALWLVGRAAAQVARGFLPADVLFGGDEAALPALLHPLVQGCYGP